MALTLTTPPVVLQTAQMTCWAAAFRSWAQAVGIRSAPPESALVSLFQGVGGALSDDQSATERGIRLMNQFGSMSSSAGPASRLTSAFLEQRLREGHIYLAFRPLDNTTPAGHVVVVYAVDGQRVSVMDPASGIRSMEVSFLRSRRHAVVGVPLGYLRIITAPVAAPQFR